MVLFGYNLGCHIGRSPTKSVDGCLGLGLQTEPEVDQLQLLVTVEQNVFGLDVAMDNIQVMQVAKSLGNSPDELFGFCLLKAVFWLRQQVVVK